MYDGLILHILSKNSLVVCFSFLNIKMNMYSAMQKLRENSETINAGQRWTNEDDKQLMEMINNNIITKILLIIILYLVRLNAP